MAFLVETSGRIKPQGKHYYSIWQILFEVDMKYHPIKIIGQGSYGTVCSCINKNTFEKVAIKKISNVFHDCTRSMRILREIKLLRHIRHENVIALKDVMMPVDRKSFQDVYLVYEFMETDLHKIINSSCPLSNNHRKYFMFQLLRGLQYLHSANILHRDLKPENLLVNSNCELKICDFGLARTNRVAGESLTDYVVTRWYRAPELLLCSDSYGPSIDVWSAGCIFAELIGRRPIFRGINCLDQLKHIISVLGTQDDCNLEFIYNPRARNFIKSLPPIVRIPLCKLYTNTDLLALDLLEKMLVFDPTKRITALEALQHPYMADLYDPMCNPPAQFPVNLDIDGSWNNDMIREMMWNEMLRYHPEAASLPS